MFASLLLAGLVVAGELTSRCLNLLALTCILNEDRLLRGRQLTSDARSTGLRGRPKSPQFGGPLASATRGIECRGEQY